VHHALTPKVNSIKVTNINIHNDLLKIASGQLRKIGVCFQLNSKWCPYQIKRDSSLQGFDDREFLDGLKHLTFATQACCVNEFKIFDLYDSKIQFYASTDLPGMAMRYG
jgi:hypothetical protein